MHKDPRKQASIMPGRSFWAFFSPCAPAASASKGGHTAQNKMAARERVSGPAWSCMLPRLHELVHALVFFYGCMTGFCEVFAFEGWRRGEGRGGGSDFGCVCVLFVCFVSLPFFLDLLSTDKVKGSFN